MSCNLSINLQGFQDGESGHYGKKLTTTLLNRLEQSYPNQPEFKQGYIDGFKDATAKGNGVGYFVGGIFEKNLFS